MSLYLSTNRKAEADQSSLPVEILENDRTPASTYASNVTTAPYNLSGRDSVRQSESSLTNTIGIAEKSRVATTNYIYYRIYAEDGAIPSKTPVAPGDPFLGHIKAISVPPPRTVKVVKRSIRKVENIKGGESTSLFLTPYSESPMDDAEKVIVLNGTGPGSTPQEPLALVEKMSDSERRALESEGRGGLASAAEPDTTSPEIRYLYYLLYDMDYELPSKVAIDPEMPSLGRIRADSVAPPHSPTSIKRCISRVEENPALAYADLFADTSSDTPLKEGHISILRTDGLGLSPNDPMAIVQRPPKEPMAIVQVKTPSIPDGKYVIKNRGVPYFLIADGSKPMKIVLSYPGSCSIENLKKNSHYQWEIKQDTNGSISMRSVHVSSSWAGADMTRSTVPVPWRLISADSKASSYYLTTEMNRNSLNPRVVATRVSDVNIPGMMTSLKEGDLWQMWEFIHI